MARIRNLLGLLWPQQQKQEERSINMVNIPPVPEGVLHLDPANILHDEFPEGIPPMEQRGSTRYALSIQEPELWDRFDWLTEQLQKRLSLLDKPQVTGWFVPVVSGPGGTLRGQARAVVTTPQGFRAEVGAYQVMLHPDVIVYEILRGARPGWVDASDITVGPRYPGFVARQGDTVGAIGAAWPEHPYAKQQGRAIFHDLDGNEARYKPGQTLPLSDGAYLKGFRVLGSWLGGAATPREYFWERIGR
jgi:hypothetical protein